MSEQRTYPRVEKNCLFVITHELGAIIRNTLDISESGLRMEQPEDKRLASGQEVRLTFSPGIGEIYTATARVVRCYQDSVALCFEQLLDSKVLARVLAA